MSEWAERYEHRLDEITSKLVELTQMRKSGAIDETEFLLRETVLREDFDEVADCLERGRKGPRPPRQRTPVRAVIRII